MGSLDCSRLWGLVDNDECVLCHNATEDREHLFGSCSIFQAVLLHFTTSLTCSNFVHDFQSLLSLFEHSSRKKSTLYRVKATLMCHIFASIWKLRNEVIFLNKVVDVKQVVREVCTDLVTVFSGFHGSINRIKKSMVRQLEFVLSSL